MRSADAAEATRVLEDARARLVDALGVTAFTTDGRTLPQVVGEMLQARGLTLAAAESCTGGLLLARMTEVAGSSGIRARGSRGLQQRAEDRTARR